MSWKTEVDCIDSTGQEMGGKEGNGRKEGRQTNSVKIGYDSLSCAVYN